MNCRHHRPFFYTGTRMTKRYGYDILSLLKSRVLILLPGVFSIVNVAAQESFIHFLFDDSRIFQNPAIPDQDYVTHNGYYTGFLETVFSQELIQLSNAQIPFQGLLNFQTYPRRSREASFRWNFGGTAFIDKFGPTEMVFIHGRAAVQWISPVGDILSLGVSAGYQHRKIDLEGTDLLQFGDPLAFLQEIRAAPDLGLGIFFSKRIFNYHDLFVGISQPHLLKLDYENAVEEWTLNDRYSLLLGANIFYSNFGYFEPTIQIETNSHFILNFRHQFKRSFWYGFGYDSRKLSNIEIGLRLRNIQSQPVITKSMENYYRIGLSYRFWSDNLSSTIGNRLGLRLAYVWL